MKKGILLFGLIISICFGASSQRKQGGGLRFTENKNQWPSQVKYRADIPSGKLFLEQTSFTYLFYDGSILAHLHHHKEEKNKEIKQTDAASNIMKMHSFQISFLNCNPQAEITAEEQSVEMKNYFIGNDPEHWASDIKSFSKISYKQIYPSTLLELFQDEDHLKYQYKISPGGNPSIIQMKYEGADTIYIQHGKLIIKTTLNTITEEAPYSYQIIRGNKITVPSAFKLDGKILSFVFPKGFNKKHELIIDPKLIFSTYSGSTADNWGNTATFDKAGNLYSGGSVFDVGFPATLGAYQVDFAGVSASGAGIDVGILKYNSTGTTLLYATYLGGSRTEIPHSLVVNENDELLILGSTSSINFPTTTGSFDTIFNGGITTYPLGVNETVLYQSGSDIFVSKLNSSGSSLMSSTFIGGSSNDGILYEDGLLTKNYGDQLRGEIITDSSNNVYIASRCPLNNM